jgi:hypothetical protein
LHDIRESKMWKQAREEGRIIERESTIKKCMAKGMTHKEIADILRIAQAELRPPAQSKAKTVNRVMPC